jgi:uncharacterized membrane protein
MHSEKIHNPQRIGPILLGLLFSLVSWTLLFGWMAIFTDAWLVPWDTFTEASKPPEDNWQRLVNDFFQLTYGFYLPGLIFVATSVILLFYAPRRRTGLWIRSGALFLLSTMLFIAFSFIAGVLFSGYCCSWTMACRNRPSEFPFKVSSCWWRMRWRFSC